MMNEKNKKIKLGVLNMTICFDKNHTKCTVPNSLQNCFQKTQQVPTFIPRYSSKRHRTSLSKAEPKISPYLAYRNSQNESIRYFREQEEAVRSSYQRIAGFSPINNTIQLSITDKTQEEEHMYTPNNFVHDNHLKMVYNKKHLRNTIDFQQQRIRTHDKLIFNFKTNPEENLKSIFTVRAAKTSQRKREKMEIKSHIKPYKQAKLIRLPQTQRDCRPKPSPNKQSQLKKIRPWSTSKNWQGKLSMFDSEILDNNDSTKMQLC